MNLLTTFLVVFTVLMVSFLMINIRHIVTGKPFRGTCAQNNPMLKKQIGECSVCGKKPDEECQMPEVKA